MAHRALFRAAKDGTYKLSELFGKKSAEKQRFQNLLILDFEATCSGPPEVLDYQEIIEFPCVVLSTADWQVKNTFHEYVRPRVNPELSSYCTELTGIIQEMVDKQPYFPQIFDKFNQWIRQNGYFDEDEKSAFITSGDWDLKVMLPKQCSLDDLPVPEYFHQWIDLKKTFAETINLYPRGLKAMSRQLQLPFTGKLHSGIDDVHNMVKIIVKLQEIHKVNFTINSSIEENDKMNVESKV